MFKNGMRPVHLGEVLREDFLKPLGMSANALAKALKVPAPRVNDIVRERRGVTAGEPQAGERPYRKYGQVRERSRSAQRSGAMRLARYFGGDARSWLNLQAAYDLRVAEISHAKRIAREISPAVA